jgi:copper chaperone CopZ/thiol-disulfide isomerase/thioredoxin
MSEYNRKVLPILGMDCPACALTIEKRLRKLEGVKEAKVNYMTQNVAVTYDPSKIGIPEIEKAIENLGYRMAYKKYEGILERVSKIFSRKKEETQFRLVSDHEFEDFVLKANKPVVVVFTSANCPACKAFKPTLRTVMERFREKVYFYEMDISKNKKWENYNVLGAPTLLYFKNGQEMSRQLGLLEQEEVESEILKLLD